MQPLRKTFRECGCAASPTLQYWDMFLSAVKIMLTNVRTDRDGKWSMHLRTLSNMLPHFCVANHINYSIWMPAYILDMLEHSEEIRSAFEASQFAIRQTSGKFNGIWSDTATEKTIKTQSDRMATCQKSALVLQDIVQRLSVRRWKKRLVLSDTDKLARRNETNSGKTL
jgi:hypothetical protein